MVKEKETIPVNVDFNASIHNRFDIEVRDAKTGELKQKAQAFNVICDALWTRMFTPANYFNYIIYGSGSGTPSASDTTLFTKINAIYAVNEVYTTDDSTENAVASLRKSITIGTETSNGTTITEVGIGYDETHIVTHAMLQDMNGNPISIPKTNTDIIYIYATMYLHYSSSLYNGGVEFIFGDHLDYNGGGYTPQGKILAQAILGNGTINTHRQLLMGNSNIVKCDDLYPTTTLNSQLKSITYSRRCLVSEYSYIRGIVTIVVGDGIIIDVTKMFNLRNFDISGEAIGTGDGTTVNFDTSFPISSNTKVYVNGNEVSAVTINTGKDREFYKLNKFYDSNHKRITPTDLLNYHDRSAYIVENDRNITFYGVTLSMRYTANPVTIYGSNDFQTWTTILSVTPPENQTSSYNFSSPNSYRFYLISSFITYTGYGVHDFALLSSADKDHDIIFTSPPASGAVITADYTPDCIPKDTNHVFDVSITVTLGEYVGN